MKRDEKAALIFLAGEPAAATSQIQRRTGRPTAPSTIRMLKRLEKLGLVAGEKWKPGWVRWWRITETGRTAIGIAPCP